MSFQLEKINMDLENTSVENIFLNDYMPQANGTFVKVYLLGYKFAAEKLNYTSKTIASHLNLLESDVLQAWDYWEKQGIIEKLYGKDSEQDDLHYNIKFLNLKQLYIENIYASSKDRKAVEKETEKPGYSDFVEKLADPTIANLFTKIDYHMRREVPYSSKQDVANWIEVYNMPPDIIEEAFFYSTEIKNIRKLSYVEAVVRNWADDNIRTKEAIEESYRQHDEKFYRYNKVKNALGLTNREYTEADFNMVNSWFDNLGFSMEVVLTACEKITNASTVSFGYINGILKNWREKGIKTLEDIELLDKKVRPKSKPGKGVKPTKFQNFEQRSSKYSEEELESIAQRKRDKYFKSKD